MTTAIQSVREKLMAAEMAGALQVDAPSRLKVVLRLVHDSIQVLDEAYPSPTRVPEGNAAHDAMVQWQREDR